MTRSYDRESKHYDFRVLTHLVETGQATFYEGPGIYVLKTEDGTVAVRPHQVIFTPDQAPFTLTVVEEKVPSPMDGYSCKEQYDLEDAGPGGVVYDGALDLAERFLALDGNKGGVDPLIIVRRILDDETGDYARLLTNEINGLPIKPVNQAARACRPSNEAAELLKHFGC